MRDAVMYRLWILALLAIAAFLYGCGGVLDTEIAPPAHIVSVTPECAVISGVLLDFAGLTQIDETHWQGDFAGQLTGSRVDGAHCVQTFELEPCSASIGWCPRE